MSSLEVKNDLPFEVVPGILKEYFRNSPPTYALSPPPSPLFVSRQWRAVWKETPEFWTFISLVVSVKEVQQIMGDHPNSDFGKAKSRYFRALSKNLNWRFAWARDLPLDISIQNDFVWNQVCDKPGSLSRSRKNFSKLLVRNITTLRTYSEKSDDGTGYFLFWILPHIERTKRLTAFQGLTHLWLTALAHGCGYRSTIYDLPRLRVLHITSEDPVYILSLFKALELKTLILSADVKD